ncbi:MAG: hypothetical protein AAB116_27550 [Candidatus Poribacteria bacterium]
MDRIEINSKIEETALIEGSQKLIYPPTEKIGVLVVDSFPSLGKLTALRFLEWVQANPDGVISLPTGKTPEYFIKWVNHYIQNWEEPEVQRDMEENGLNPGVQPNIEILGYRNVWYRFHPSEANIYVPVSLNMFAVLQNAFMNAFVSQKDASFPSYECDAPFSVLAQQIQVQQYQMLKPVLDVSFSMSIQAL